MQEVPIRRGFQEGAGRGRSAAGLLCIRVHEPNKLVFIAVFWLISVLPTSERQSCGAVSRLRINALQRCGSRCRSRNRMRAQGSKEAFKGSPSRFVGPTHQRPSVGDCEASGTAILDHGRPFHCLPILQQGGMKRIDRVEQRRRHRNKILD